jgi:hypothetical protein
METELTPIGKALVKDKEKTSNEAVELLRTIAENCVHIGGSDYRIGEKYLTPAENFLNRLTD